MKKSPNEKAKEEKQAKLNAHPLRIHCADNLADKLLGTDKKAFSTYNEAKDYERNVIAWALLNILERLERIEGKPDKQP